MRRLLLVPVVAVVLVLVTGSAAYACGSLVGPNGAVNLVRTSTLAAWHDGVEHYVTNFEFASNETSFGSIIPLPAQPTKVERGGDWTLQRLAREVAPLRQAFAGDAAEAAPATDGVDVLQQTRIDSLDVTILRGGGVAVAEWAAQQGFELTPDTPEVLEFYSSRSRYFMAAKFDASAAVAQGLSSGDGIPVHLTIPVDRPWVPLRILGTGKPASEPVQADVFLLTDTEPGLLAGPGLRLERSEPASISLLNDLRADKGMDWVPDDMWLTYLKADVDVGDLTYDLAASPTRATTPLVRDTGVDQASSLVAPTLDQTGSFGPGVLVAGVATVLVALGVAISARPARARRRAAAGR
jgi:Uncharacterized protein conserved in bacteria (DUF2330)